MKTLLVALAALLSLLAMAPADAHDETRHGRASDATPRPMISEGWQISPGPEGAKPSLAIAGRHGWGVRRFAREADRQIPGLRIFTRGGCAAHPTATCVRVRVVEAPRADWYGIAKWKDYDRRVILLNAALRDDARYAVAVHEFGHVLGLGHHAMHGIDGGTPDVVHLSAVERRTLRTAYPAR